MLIHCTMEELVAIRDGEGSAGALRHLDDCEECRNELELLHQRVAALRALPSVAAPRDRWPAVREQVLGERGRRRRKVVGWVSMAVAASVALAVGVGQLAQMVRGTAEDDPYTVLVEEAQSLEDMLRTIDVDSRVLNGRAASAVALIEDRLSLVDARLADARAHRIPTRNLIVLMRQRVNLLDALVGVHATKSTYVGF